MNFGKLNFMCLLSPINCLCKLLIDGLRMSYLDWLENFNACQIVNICPESLIDTNVQVNFF